MHITLAPYLKTCICGDEIPSSKAVVVTAKSIGLWKQRHTCWDTVHFSIIYVMIRLWCYAYLPSFIQPESIHLHSDGLPTTPNDKIDFKELSRHRELCLSATTISTKKTIVSSGVNKDMIKLSLFDHTDDEAHPLSSSHISWQISWRDSDLAAIVIDAWQRVLQLDHVPQGDDSFFEQGGDSLAALRLVTVLKKAIAVPVNFADDDVRRGNIHGALSPFHVLNYTRLSHYVAFLYERGPIPWNTDDVHSARQRLEQTNSAESSLFTSAIPITSSTDLSMGVATMEPLHKQYHQCIQKLLWYAVESNCADLLETVLNVHIMKHYGVDPSDGICGQRRGMSPLHRACQIGCKHIVKVDNLTVPTSDI